MADIPPKAFMIVGLLVAAASGFVNYTQGETRTFTSVLIGKFSLFLVAGIVLIGWGIFVSVAYSDKRLREEEAKLLAQEKGQHRHAHQAAHAHHQAQRAQQAPPHPYAPHAPHAAAPPKETGPKRTDLIMEQAKRMYDEMQAAGEPMPGSLTPYPLPRSGREHHATPAHHPAQRRSRPAPQHDYPHPHTPNFCPNCGARTAPGARFCMGCGYNF
ncbi:zinc ribbon domain-containing protein [Candidatus Woesearchaeota archaeon]|nr:zinc ribbon domain-containing protein [Candidatus Woesearchaeota archaeon]